MTNYQFHSDSSYYRVNAEGKDTALEFLEDSVVSEEDELGLPSPYNNKDIETDYKFDGEFQG